MNTPRDRDHCRGADGAIRTAMNTFRLTVDKTTAEKHGRLFRPGCATSVSPERGMMCESVDAAATRQNSASKKRERRRRFLASLVTLREPNTRAFVSGLPVRH